MSSTSKNIQEAKSKLEQAKTFDDVNKVVLEIAPLVKDLEASTAPGDVTQAIQIKNLAKYRRLCIANRWE